MCKKTTKFFGLMAAATMLFSACDKESYTHQLGIVYPVGTSLTIYADQTVDSIRFATFDSYRYFAYNGNPDDFISIDPSKEKQTLQNNPVLGWIFSLPVYFKQNTTDTCRVGFVGVHSYGAKWESTVYGVYFQTNWHKITRPAPYLHYTEDNSLLRSADHVLLDSAMQLTDTLVFTAYDAWTLASADEEIVKPAVLEGQKGVNKVPLTTQYNTTADTLKTSLTLRSVNGAKTVIQFKQKPGKKKK